MKKNNTFLYILIFILFLALGVTLGVYGAKKYLNSKNDKDLPEVVDGVIDITDKKEYEESVKNLYGVLDGNPIFYTSNGLSLDTMDNNTKLNLMYYYVLSNKMGTSDTMPWTYYGSSNCDYDFIVDPLEEGEESETCTVLRIPTNTFKENYKKLFNSSVIDTSVNFKPNTYKSCVVDGDDYVCGNVGAVSTGSLDSKFEITKVTLEQDILTIYDKGYLIDTRSDKVNFDDGYENHYLHTSDSTEYYYELKSSDNVTFKHTFKKAEDNKYYYVSTEVVEKE